MPVVVLSRKVSRQYGWSIIDIVLKGQFLLRGKKESEPYLVRYISFEGSICRDDLAYLSVVAKAGNFYLNAV